MRYPFTIKALFCDFGVKVTNAHYKEIGFSFSE